MQLLFTGSLDSRGGYFPPRYIFTSQYLSLLISFVILLPTTHLLLWKYENWRALWAAPNMLRRERALKTAACSVLFSVFMVPLKLILCTAFEPTVTPTFGGDWQIPDTITILRLHKNKWLHIRESSSLHFSAMALGIPEVSIQLAFRQHTHTRDLMYNPDIWKQLLLKLAVSLAMQTWEKLCFCYSPDCLTCLSSLQSTAHPF